MTEAAQHINTCTCGQGAPGNLRVVRNQSSQSVRLSTYAQLRRDPTHTTTLRNQFSRAMGKRFRELRGLIRKAIVDQDCFGLQNNPTNQNDLTTQALPQRRQFDFSRSQDKVSAFMDWLRKQEDQGILEIRPGQQIGEAVENAWSNQYIQSAYQKGIYRGRQELVQARYPVPGIEETGGIDQAFNQPFHMDRVGLMYTRTFNELKGITDAMDQQISRVLSQGIAEGKNPNDIARLLNRTISGPSGDLGLTDTLGRWIPAERRARILARTEVIRAHHSATIQEYKNWQAEGVKVKAEWSTAGDARVCPECAMLEGRTYTLKEAEGMIPRHPQCFIDPQIPIYTSEGWKKIGDIQIGEQVLTHKGRFRKVYATPRKKKQKPGVVKFKFKGDLSLSMTANHPVLVSSKSDYTCARWKEAGKVNEHDLIVLLASRCKRCGEKIPYFRKYCSRTCLSKDITDTQWADPNHRRIISEKNSRSMKEQYRLGLRDRDQITKAANEKIRSMVADGSFGWWMGKEWEMKVKGVTNTPEHRDASSQRMRLNNPMHDPDVVAKAVERNREYYLKYPERHPNVLMAQKGRRTGPEQQMKDLLDAIGLEYNEQYPIKSPNGGRGRGAYYYVDFALRDLKIVIEVDGIYWHEGAQDKDATRQEDIEKQGWTVIRYTDQQLNTALDDVQDEICRIAGNHTGSYEFLGWPIQRIEKWKVEKKGCWLYNLSVEEDESYIAKGAVVHNCRCIALPLDVTDEGEAAVDEGAPPSAVESAVKKWVGVEESPLSLQDFRYGNMPEASILREAVMNADTIDTPSYRGTVMPRGIVESLSSGAEIELPPIASFSKTKSIAKTFSEQGDVMARSFGQGPMDKVIFKVDRLESGLDIGDVADSLKGQKEILSHGKLRIQEITKEGDIFVIRAFHMIE